VKNYSSPLDYNDFDAIVERARIQRSLDWLKQEIEIVLRDRLHRVQLGPYQDRKEAALVAERIREALEFRPIVVKR